MKLPEFPRVCHAYKIHVPDPTTGGITEIIRTLATRLGWPSEIVVARPHGLGRTDVVEGVRVYRSTSFGSLWSMPLAPFYPLLLWQRSRQVDIVDYHFPFPLADLAFALWLPRRVALVVHWHAEIAAQKAVLPYIGWLLRRTLRRADCIVVSSQALLDHSPFLRAFAEKCVVVPYGIDTESWSTLDAGEQLHVEDLRQRCRRSIVAVGRLVSYKGFDVLLDAMPKVDGQLTIVGSGPLQDRLVEQIKSLQLQDRVHLTGYMEHSELKCLLHACNVFVLPSVEESEAFGLVQLEAMAAGTPIINTCLPTAVPWVARDGQEGLTVTPRSADELAAALTRLLDDPVFASELGQRGRRRAAERFSADRFIRETAEAYSAALGKRRQTDRNPQLARSGNSRQ